VKLNLHRRENLKSRTSSILVYRSFENKLGNSAGRSVRHSDGSFIGYKETHMQINIPATVQIKYCSSSRTAVALIGEATHNGVIAISYAMVGQFISICTLL
jgi:hypothetical protein